MAVASVMRPLGTPAPPFELRDVRSGQLYTLESFKGTTALLVMFLCRHCPYVQHIQEGLARLAEDYESRSVGMIGISSNDRAQYPDDAPERLKDMVERLGFRFPLCFDGTQTVAKAFQAACTPEFFLYDVARLLAYRGQFDESRPSNRLPVTGRDLRAAIDDVLAGRPVSGVQKPGVGCSIKWKPNTAPPYAG